MQNWIIYTIIYAIFTGFFQSAKKKAVEKNSIYEVLAVFSLIAFILIAFTSNNVFNIEMHNIFIILVKSLVVVTAWLLGLYAISIMPLSLYSVINLSKIIFSIIMSVIFLGERLTSSIIIGAFIIISGLILVNKLSNKKEDQDSIG